MAKNYYYRNEIKATDRTDSKMLNDAFKGIATDITTLYSDLFGLQNDTEAHIAANGSELAAFQTQIQALESLINSSIDNEYSYISSYDNVTKVIYPNVAGSQKASWEREYGVAYLPILNSVKEYLIASANGTYTLIPDIEEYIYYYTTNNLFLEKVDRIQENSITNAIDSDPNSAFMRKIIASNPTVNEIDMIYELTLVEQRDINLVKVIPIPELQIDIHQLILESPGAGKVVPVQPTGTQYTFPIMETPRQAFFTVPTQTLKVILVTRQRTKVGTDPSVFNTGARYISIENNTYSNLGYIGYKFAVPSGKTGIYSVEPEWLTDDQSRMFVYTNEDNFNEANDQYIFRRDGESLLLTEPYLFGSVNNIYVLFELRPITGLSTTSVLKGCKIRWT